jgi:hypothetical protein
MIPLMLGDVPAELGSYNTDKPDYEKEEEGEAEEEEFELL